MTSSLPSSNSETYAKALAALSAVEYVDFGEPDEAEQTKAVMRVVLNDLRAWLLRDDTRVGSGYQAACDDAVEKIDAMQEMIDE